MNNLKKWLLLELKINQKIMSFFESIKKHTPLFIKKSFLKLVQFSAHSKNETLFFIKERPKKLIIYISNHFKRLIEYLGHFQGHLTQLVLSVRSLRKQKGYFKNSYRNTMSSLFSYLYDFQTWYLKFKKSTLILALVATSVISYSLINLYSHGHYLLQKIGRRPASIPPSVMVDVRPNYYKKDEKHFTLYHVKLPLFIESIQDQRNIKVDLTIRSSNKFIKEYFFRNEYLIHDKLNVMIQPIVPSLPTTQEGQIIIKEKVRIELNQLLKEHHVKGEVEEVYIKSSLGT